MVPTVFTSPDCSLAVVTDVNLAGPAGYRARVFDLLSGAVLATIPYGPAASGAPSVLAVMIWNPVTKKPDLR